MIALSDHKEQWHIGVARPVIAFADFVLAYADRLAVSHIGLAVCRFTPSEQLNANWK
jgi:hypothetical protein